MLEKLDVREEPSDPLTRRLFLDPGRLRKIAEKHGVEPEKLEAMLEDWGSSDPTLFRATNLRLSKMGSSEG